MDKSRRREPKKKRKIDHDDWQEKPLGKPQVKHEIPEENLRKGKQKKKSNGEADESQDTRMGCEFCIFVGPPNSGKSHLLRWLSVKGFLEGKWDWIMVLSPTKHNGDFDYIHPQSAVVSDFSQYEQKVNDLLDIQTETAKKLGRIPVAGEGRVLLIIDDALGTIDWMAKKLKRTKDNKPRTNVWDRLASTFRQYGVDVFISTQYIPKLPKAYFGTATCGYIFKVNMESDVKYIFDRWIAGQETDFKNHLQFWDWMKEKMPSDENKYLRISRTKYDIPLKLDQAPDRKYFQKYQIKLEK